VSGQSLALGRRVLALEAGAIQALEARLDERFEQAVELILACAGRTVVTGIGKSGIVGRKIAATLSSTGTPALFLHPAEAAHGDLGAVARRDVVVALSYSGEADEIVCLLESFKRMGLPLIALTGMPGSTLAKSSDVVLDVSVEGEACPLGLAPSASTTAMLALGDALALALLDRRGFRAEDFADLHPGGRLGARLRRVEQLMHSGEAMPCVRSGTPMPEVIYEMSRKGLGITSVVDADGRLQGCVSDGDLRRLFERRRDALDLRAEDCMTRTPATIAAGELAAAALHIMERRRITALMVTGDDGRLAGVLHLHDLWQAGLL
jgi:arabinose-5-phosphate isomerase